MTLQSSGAISFSQIRAEFGGGSGAISASELYRGGSRVRGNAANNPSTNWAAGVPTSGALPLSTFYGAARGFYYYANAAFANYYMSYAFGADWDVDYPKMFEIGPSGVAGATSINDYAFTIVGGAGSKILINRGEIQGAGGAADSGAGQHALRIAGTVDLYNYGAIRGGGGGGGHGGTGGTGGQGYYGYTLYEPSSGYTYTSGWTYWSVAGSTVVKWGGSEIYNVFNSQVTTVTSGAYTYYRGNNIDGNGMYSIMRTSAATAYTYGGGGGAGGSGGLGQGFNHARTGGAAGTPGGAGDTNAGAGGAGGAGGLGGTWGAAGATGNYGNSGASGNYTGGSAGYAGGGGGAAGYAIYATVGYNRYVNGTLNGTVT